MSPPPLPREVGEEHLKTMRGRWGGVWKMTGSLVKTEKVVKEKLKAAGRVSHTTDTSPGTRLSG